MRELLLLRLDAPLMSFGAPTVDALGKTARHPSRSMLTGLLANALGWDHCEPAKLQALQQRLTWAARLDCVGQALTEYQTVDLGLPHMLTSGKNAVSWTTRGRTEERRGGAASEGTHQRWRDHWADAVYTVAIGLASGDAPTVADLAEAVQRPARPLFLGRKACLPAAPLFIAVVQAETLADALAQATDQSIRNDRPGSKSRKAQENPHIWWPTDDPKPANVDHCEELYVTEERDWRNQIHVGERRICHGVLTNRGAP